jgi:hypothetical protein
LCDTLPKNCPSLSLIRFAKVIDDLLDRQTLLRHALLPSPWIQKPVF